MCMKESTQSRTREDEEKDETMIPVTINGIVIQDRSIEYAVRDIVRSSKMLPLDTELIKLLYSVVISTEHFEGLAAQPYCAAELSEAQDIVCKAVDALVYYADDHSGYDSWQTTSSRCGVHDLRLYSSSVKEDMDRIHQLLKREWG